MRSWRPRHNHCFGTSAGWLAGRRAHQLAWQCAGAGCRGCSQADRTHPSRNPACGVHRSVRRDRRAAGGAGQPTGPGDRRHRHERHHRAGPGGRVPRGHLCPGIPVQAEARGLPQLPCADLQRHCPRGRNLLWPRPQRHGEARAGNSRHANWLVSDALASRTAALQTWLPRRGCCSLQYNVTASGTVAKSGRTVESSNMVQMAVRPSLRLAAAKGVSSSTAYANVTAQPGPAAFIQVSVAVEGEALHKAELGSWQAGPVSRAHLLPTISRFSTFSLCGGQTAPCAHR